MTFDELHIKADRAAAELGADAGPAELLAGTADPEVGAELRADLLAHGLAASHRIMLRLCAASKAVLNWSHGTAADLASADTSKADLSAARAAAVAARLMEQTRLGLVALQRCRPAADEEGVWLGLHWMDGRCSDEEFARRLAAAKAAKAANAAAERPAPDLSERAKARRAAAAETAARLVEEAHADPIALVAADAKVGVGFLSRLFAHELGAVHALMMRLAGSTDRAIDRAVDRKEEPAAALQLAGVVARLGDRYRRGMATLDKLAGGPGGGPGKVAGVFWAGTSGGYRPDQPAAPAANDTAGHGVLPQDPQAKPAATAGHGVLRLVSSGPGRALPLHGRPRAVKTRHPGASDRRAQAAGQGR